MHKKNMSHIVNHAAYHAAVKRNAAAARKVQANFLQKGFGAKGNRVLSRAVKKGAYAAADRYGGAGTSSFIKSVVGRGDYKIYTGRGLKHKQGAKHDGGSMVHAKSRNPRISLEKGEMIIEHSEFLGEVISGATASTIQPFTSQVYQINPGNQGTFPWLSGTAINFQMYEFEKLIFEYKPLVSDSATSTTTGALTSMGSVIMATQYDSVLGPFINKNTMENSDFAASCKPSCGLMHAVECQPKFNPLGVLYVSGGISNTSLPLTGTNANPQNTDVRFQNLGMFQISSNLIPTIASTPIDLGEIWVHYKVKLLKPVLNAGLSNVLSSHYYLNTGVTVAAPFGTAPTASPTSYLPLIFNTAGTTFSFPLAVTEGSFLCIYSMLSLINANAYNPPTVANGTLVKLFQSTGGTDASVDFVGAPQTTLAGDLQFAIYFIVSVNAPGASLCSVTINLASIGGAPQGELLVTPWNTMVTN